MRLRTSDPGRPGYTRRRHGKGFSYRDEKGATIRDNATVARIKALVIPPAWQDVWICPDPRGHIQATGRDAAGRRQYLYHPDWRAQRDEQKFDHVLEVATHLPELRRRVAADLGQKGLTRARVLAALTRLLDMGSFRVGSDEYASDDDPTYGVSTLRPDHVFIKRGCVSVEFPAKGGVDQCLSIDDAEVRRVIRDLRRRRRGADRLWAYWDRGARRWRNLHSEDVNDYLREAAGILMTAKDFRTWHATVRAAEELADEGWHPSRTRRKRAVSTAVKAVAEMLGNTPTVARSSYVDPRVIDRYHEDALAEPGRDPERTVREMLDSRSSRRP
jgi:DNA topoisomerase IB